MLAYAKVCGLGSQAWDRLFPAYFGEARSVFDVDSLVVLGEEVGLDPAELRTALGERRYRFNVENDDHAARSRGAEGVPYFLFAGRYAIPGAESAETILRGLTLGWEHVHARTAPIEVLSSTGAACGPDGCRVP
jgi:predicted DsbA family dithiol-disulfide isomerase